MKKRNVIATLVIAICILLPLEGWIMTSMRGPGPDWNIQQGTIQSVGDQAEASKRATIRTFGLTTGTILWGTGFEDGTIPSEVIVETDGIVYGAYAAINNYIASTGAQSLRLHIGSNINGWAGISRFVPLVKLDPFINTNKYRIGLMFEALPALISGGNCLQTMEFLLQLSYPTEMGEQTGAFISGIRISREAGGVEKIYYFDQDHVWTDTGLIPINFWKTTADIYTWFHQFKLVINPTRNTAKYSYLEMDGVRYDLSNLQPQITASTYHRSHIKFYVKFTNNEAGYAKDLYIDNLILTGNEP